MIILDITMPNLTGIEAVHHINMNFPHVNVLILTMHKDSQLFHQAILAGAKGYLLKDDMSELIPAIEVISKGEVYIPRFISARKGGDEAEQFADKNQKHHDI